ncbi:hypothetical protein BGY98DRAFT_992186 [Russula aff. rugulosa BPL654]|nr:hypothetical protein BGY98DRAFT_992186 [Russula aff. rugulosa BPL654]
MSIPVISSRTAGEVELHLSPKSPVPKLPYELHEHVTADAWAARIPQLITLCNRYNRPVLEGVWFIVMFIASIAVPAGLHGPILDSLRKNMTLPDAIVETRFITFVIAIGILMLFFGPHIVWKFMGQKRATELVKKWETEDARLHAPGSFIPVWTVKLAGYLSYDTPPIILPSSCYHPAWMNGPVDSGSPNGAPATYQGFQQQAMYGDVPLYGNGAGLSLPPYASDGRAYSDEKMV